MPKHPSEDDLAMLAIGEPVPDVEGHVRACAECDGEVRALRATVDTARSSDMLELASPPPAVWQRIADELGFDPQAHVPQADDLQAQDLQAHDLQAVVQADDVVVPLRRSPWRRPLVAGAAALALTAAATAVVVSVRTPASQPPDAVTVELVALGGTTASGEVAVTDGPRRRALVVDTSGLPPADGFYEVWLLDLERERMVALGVLDDDGRGRLTVPDGVRVSDYPEVDVSLEPDDGDPAHSGNSVLRGELPV